ncbi:hypothetical protein IGI04_014421 [Brassica rapa subsp. trilocularis]|uniref:Thioredoxin domain-containing protein n=1 Tax=Brassica rapa subsp. trilocularis TaxID=1813537 RepID=A0ABQ7MM57_BRACM|nr:hypothetical protein IGI04_014421 [Brassica rapa subsp. trilocularis]
MGNRCARTPCCTKLWSCICCCCSNNKARARSQHGSKENVYSISRIEKWEEKITEANNNGKILVVYFSAPWCVPCKKIEPVFRELASRYPSMIFVTIDVEELAINMEMEKGLDEGYIAAKAPLIILQNSVCRCICSSLIM